MLCIFTMHVFRSCIDATDSFLQCMHIRQIFFTTVSYKYDLEVQDLNSNISAYLPVTRVKWRTRYCLPLAEIDVFINSDLQGYIGLTYIEWTGICGLRLVRTGFVIA